MLKIQASSVHRIIQCPRSVVLEQTIDKDCAVRYAADAADLGKRYHAAGEAVLKGATVASALKAEGFVKGTDEYITGKHTVSYYAKYMKKIARKRPVRVEEKHELINNDWRFVAKFDAALIDESKKELHVFDLKTGNFDYSSSAFDQLGFTAWLLMLDGTIKTDDHWKVTLHIVQPNFYDEAHRTAAQKYEINSPGADVAFHSLCASVIESDEYNPGDHCTFCPALPVCPAYHNNEVINMNNAIIIPENLPDEQLERIVIKKKEIEKFLSACEEYAKNKLAKGHAFSNLQLASGKGHRRWIDADTAKKKLIEHAPLDEITDTKLKSPAQIEKLLGKDALDGLVEQPDTVKLVVRENVFGVIE